MIVLDASAVLALLNDEPGEDRIRDALTLDSERVLLGAANWAEVAGKVTDAGGDAVRLLDDLGTVVAVEPVTVADAILAGTLRSLEWARALCLGDRLCLALAARRDGTTVLTADRAWAACDLPIQVQVIR